MPRATVSMRPSFSTVLLYDPALSSFNMGDHVISEACHRHLGPLLDDAFVIEISSHLPVSQYLTWMRPPTHRFVCGSNLLRGRLNSRFRQWDITPRYAHLMGPAVLMGVGWWQYGDDLNAYTRWIYRRVLSGEITHSVRDDFTAARLRSMGLKNVLNTSCPTMWDLTEEHCALIPTERGSIVVTTVTDYRKDPLRDRQMLLDLAREYRGVYIWVQGAGDIDYLHSLDLDWRKFEIVPPALERMDEMLREPEVEYVGTRLHAGIRALQHGRRSLIIGVDNRAAEKRRDFNLPCLPREDLGTLRQMLRQPRRTGITIPVAAIAEWKCQFPELANAGAEPVP